jgi:hypothetical protein
MCGAVGGGYLSSFLSRLAGVKYRIHCEHGWDTFDPEGNNKKYQLLRRLLSPLVQVFISLSAQLQALKWFNKTGHV